MATQNYLAMDFGASSGRGIVGRFDGNKLKMEEIYRFEHYLHVLNKKIYWDILDLHTHSKNMLKKAAVSQIELAGIGIDTWGVDYGLLDKNGDLLGNVLSYRNSVQATADKVWEKVSNRDLFSITGVGHLVYNTIYQLYERKLRGDASLENAETAMMLPDILAYLLTGEKASEYTDAMTSMLIDTKKGTWSEEILNKLGLPGNLFPEIQMPGTLRGKLTDAVCEEMGVPKTPLFTVAAHDTAAAIGAVPAGKERFAYISSGTWSLMGTESDEAVVSEKAFLAGYSNEGSLQGKFRLNKNIMGLGLIQQCRREWQSKGMDLSWDEIVQAAAQAEPFKAFLDMDAEEFFNLQNLTKKIPAYCAQRGVEVTSVGEISRCIYESLAMKYRYAIQDLEDITGVKYEAVYIVGGGCKNDLLNQFTANATGVPVIAGPAEGASMANALTQAMAVGEIHGLGQLREVVRNSTEVKTFMPKDTEQWAENYEKFLKMTGL